MRPWIAVALFAILFVLSQDYWSWDDPVKLALLGLPRWVYVFALLQVGVSAVVMWYGYRDESDSKQIVKADR